MKYRYSYGEIKPIEHMPLHVGPMYDGLPDGTNAEEINFQGAADLDDGVEFAIVGNVKIFREEMPRD